MMRSRRVSSLVLALSLALSLGAIACSGSSPAERAGPTGRTSPPARTEAPHADETASSEDPPAPEPPAPRRVTIGAGGDVLVHLKVWRSAREHEDAGAGGFNHVFGDLRRVIDEREVAIANLETPLSTRIDPETGEPPVLGAPAEVADGLAFAGLDAVGVANNHSYDQTAAGMDDTLRALEAAGVGAAGAASTQEDAAGPVVIERDGVRVALVAFTERINRGPVTQGARAHVARWAEEPVRAALALARERADVVVASVHWSHDYVTRPLDRQRERARFMVDAGADLIIGHGPHVLQEVERLESPRGEAIVAYSLGNLVSNQGLRYMVGRTIPEDMHPAVVLPEVRDGAWLRARFAIEDGRVTIDALEAVPLFTHNNYLEVTRRAAPRLDIRARALRDADPALQAERRPVIARALGPAVTLLP